MNYRQYKKRRKNRMYIDTFNLDYNISKYILPRLKIFKETHMTLPPNLIEEEWNNILDKMILAFQLYVYEDFSECLFKNKKEYEIKTKQLNDGLDLFRKYFFDLWS